MWLRTGALAHVGGSRDLAVVETLRDERHDLALAIRELRKERREVGFSATGSPAPRATARSSTSPSSTLRPRHNCAQRRRDARHVLLDEVASSPQRQGSHDVLIVGEGSEKDHARRHRSGEDSLGSAQAVHAGHLDVEKNDVRRRVSRQAHGVGPVSPAAHDPRCPVARPAQSGATPPQRRHRLRCTTLMRSPSLHQSAARSRRRSNRRVRRDRRETPHRAPARAPPSRRAPCRSRRRGAPAGARPIISHRKAPEPRMLHQLHAHVARVRVAQHVGDGLARDRCEAARHGGRRLSRLHAYRGHDRRPPHRRVPRRRAPAPRGRTRHHAGRAHSREPRRAPLAPCPPRPRGPGPPGSPARATRYASACTTARVSRWPTLSWMSRAMRARSASVARRTS